MNYAATLLVADDDDTDILLLNRAFKHVGLDSPVQVVRDGEEAIAFLSRPRSATGDGPPALLVLDVQMPKRSGLEVLEWMRGQVGLRSIPVILFSSSAHPADVERAYLLGANAYLVKPPSTQVRVEIARFIKDWIRFNQVPLISPS